MKPAIAASILLCSLLTACVHVPEFHGTYTRIGFNLGGTAEMNTRLDARLRKLEYKRAGMEMGFVLNRHVTVQPDYEASTIGFCDGVPARVEGLIAEAARDMPEKEAILAAYRRTVTCEEELVLLEG